MKRKLSSLLSIILCLALCLGTFAWADEAAPEPSASPSTSEAAPDAEGPEEVIYARLDASGKPQDAYAVVALTLTEDGTVEHYGRYTDVENLTDTSPIEYRGGVVSLTAPAGRYYYQGTLRSAKMPWDIEITYTLDGQEISPDELGGKSGELEVDIHTQTNSGFDPYFTENYMLQISVTLDADLCEDIAARNGTIANSGSDKQITFVVLPGGEGDLGFSAKVRDFSMGGFTIAAVPYSMDSVMDMSEVDGITSGLKQLSSAVTQLTGGASTINDGAATLGENGPALNDASDQIESALRQIANELQGFDLSEMTGGLDQLQELPAGLTQVAAYLSQMGDGAMQLYNGYVQVTDGLSDALTLISQMMPGGGTTGGETGGETGGGTGGMGDMSTIIAGLSGKISSAIAEAYSNGYTAGYTDGTAGNEANPSIDPSYLENAVNGILGSLTGGGATSSGGSGSGGETGGVTDAISGLSQAVSGLQLLNSELKKLADGLYTMSDQMMQMAIEISSGLDGMTDIDTSGISELQSGMATLADSYEQFNDGLKTYTDGVSQLADGMDTYTSGMYSLNSETQTLPEMIDAFLGTGDSDEGEGESSDDASEVVSFLDERNTDTASVQFVISTDGISEPEAPTQDQPAEEPQGFFARLWDKIVALFTGD